MMRRTLAPLPLVVLLTACLTSGQLGVTPRPSIAGVAPEPSLAPGATPIPELRVTGQNLPAGTYTRDVFAPRILLDLDGNWEAVQLLQGFFDVQQFPDSPDVYAVQFARPTHVESAEEAVAFLRQSDSLTVLESSTSLIDGHEGLQITVENTSGTTTPIMTAPPGTLSIDDGRRLWIAYFDTSAGLLAIMVGGSIDKWDEALAAAEPVLESIRIID
jgi:hypothetical protein